MGRAYGGGVVYIGMVAMEFDREKEGVMVWK